MITFLLLNLFTFHFHFALAGRLEKYYGDVSFFDYLRKLCQKDSPIMVNNFQLLKNSDNNETNSQEMVSGYEIHKLLLELNCRHKMYDNISVSALNGHLPQVEYYLHNRKRLIIYDFTKQKNLNIETLQNILLSVNAVFEYCKPCLPSIVLFSCSTDYLLSISAELFALNLLPPTFRVVLVANLDRPFAAVFWRPLVDGCSLYHNVLRPKEDYQFKRLKVRFRDCNLKAIRLNVSVNEVTDHESL